MTRKLTTLFLGFTLLSVAGAGCVVADSDDDTFYVDWRLEWDTGEPTTCTLAGASSVDLDLLNLDTEDEIHINFPCKDKGGRTEHLPRGEYSVALRLRNKTGDLLSEFIARDTFQLYGNGAVLPTIVFQVYPNDQYFELTWEIEKQGTRALLSCAQAAASVVQLETRLLGADPVVYRFNCADGVGRTTTVQPGIYGIAISLLGFGDRVLSFASMEGQAVLQGQPFQIPMVFEVE